MTLEWHQIKIVLLFLLFSSFSYPTALEMISCGKIDVKPLITHRFDLEQTVEAFETSRTGKGGAVKVIIKCCKE